MLIHRINTASKRSANFFSVPESQCLKTLLVEGSEENSVVALVLRGDHELNEIKASNHPDIASPFCFASDEQIKQSAGCSAGSLGPVGLKIKVIADYAALQCADFVCGANEDGKHLTGVNWKRDCALPVAADLRNIVEGDASPDGKGTLSIVRGIEVGHIFQLGTKYSEAMKATVLNENGKATTMAMGCYGIGITRIVASAIEQNNDENGIIWTKNLAPFDVAIAPINMQKSEEVRNAAIKLHDELTASGLDVLLYDEKARLGGMLADLDLIGIPHRVVIGDRGLKENKVEYKSRSQEESKDIALDEIVTFLTK